KPRLDEFLRADDPAALAAILAAGELTQLRPLVAEPVVMVAPLDPVGGNEMVRSESHRLLCRPGRQRADPAVVLEGETEAAEEALEKPDGRRAGIDLHVEDARLQGLGQEVD